MFLVVRRHDFWNDLVRLIAWEATLPSQILKHKLLPVSRKGLPFLDSCYIEREYMDILYFSFKHMKNMHYIMADIYLSLSTHSTNSE